MTSNPRRHPYGGVYASTICPMHADGTLDEKSLGRHLEAVVHTEGMAGLLVNGHAGENFALDEDELFAVVEIAREVSGPSRVVAGVNAERTDVAARMAADAARAGADAVMVFPPFSWALGADDRLIQAHHRAVAKASGLPVFLFQGSVASGRTAFGARTLAGLLEIDSVVGIKEGSWETAAYEATRRLVGRLRPDVGVMASGDEHLFTCFAIGSEGSLVSLAALVPEMIGRPGQGRRRWRHGRGSPRPRAALRAGAHRLRRAGSPRHAAPEDLPRAPGPSRRADLAVPDREAVRRRDRPAASRPGGGRRGRRAGLTACPTSTS